MQFVICEILLNSPLQRASARVVAAWRKTWQVLVYENELEAGRGRGSPPNFRMAGEVGCYGANDGGRQSILTFRFRAMKNTWRITMMTLLARSDDFRIFVIQSDRAGIGAISYWINGRVAEIDLWIGDRIHWGARARTESDGGNRRHTGRARWN